MAAKTLRDLVAGSGTVDTVSGSTKLVFSQQFKRGATIPTLRRSAFHDPGRPGDGLDGEAEGAGHRLGLLVQH
jgi:hypothetical protein